MCNFHAKRLQKIQRLLQQKRHVWEGEMCNFHAKFATTDTAVYRQTNQKSRNVHSVHQAAPVQEARLGGMGRVG